MQFQYSEKPVTLCIAVEYRSIADPLALILACPFIRKTVGFAGRKECVNKIDELLPRRQASGLFRSPDSHHSILLPEGVIVQCLSALLSERRVVRQLELWSDADQRVAAKHPPIHTTPHKEGIGLIDNNTPQSSNALFAGIKHTSEAHLTGQRKRSAEKKSSR